MTKKKKSSAADDLLDSLLEDVKKSSDSDSGSEEVPEGFIGKSNEVELVLPKIIDDNLDIPSLHGHFQSPDEVFKSSGPQAEKSVNIEDMLEKVDAFGRVISKPLAPPPFQANDETVALPPSSPPPGPKESVAEKKVSESERTVAVTAFAQKKKHVSVEDKIPKIPQYQNQQVFTAVDASLAQAESLKFAQQRILQLEKEIDRYRQENDDLATAAEIIKFRADELENKLVNLEREKTEVHEQANSEILLLKGHLQHREMELGKAKVKIEELDNRLKSDFKKIRSKERELENRLELMRAEKLALIHAKDDHILELQRRMDQMKAEMDNYRAKIHELNKAAEAQNEQIKRTVRALRLALTNLESKGDVLVPVKKAE